MHDLYGGEASFLRHWLVRLGLPLLLACLHVARGATGTRARAGISAPDGRRIQATPRDNYQVKNPLSGVFEHNVILAVREGGSCLPIRKRGPFLIIDRLDDRHSAEERYYSRCAWQLRSLDVK